MSERTDQMIADAGTRLREDGPVLTAENLTFRYRPTDGAEHAWSLGPLSFHVEAGEIVGIVGPNGSGKSSLLRLLAGLAAPSDGEILLRGRPLGQLGHRDIARVVAIVPQDHVQVFPFTVAETVLMGRHPHHPARLWSLGVGEETEADLACAQRAMSDTDVWSLADRLVSELSGGERQRVVIARALAQEPDVLLLDEPTAFLDINHQIEMGRLISRLRAERRLTVVLVSHDLNVASQYCDRVLVLKDGRLVRMGTPEETIRPDILRTVYGCDVIVDAHPHTGRPRVTIPMGLVVQ
ncbi:MAG: ABC transporter ATP-binding protein [Nitrospiraceae bacterium]